MNAGEINTIGVLLQSIRHPDKRSVAVSLSAYAPGFDKGFTEANIDRLFPRQAS